MTQMCSDFTAYTNVLFLLETRNSPEGVQSLYFSHRPQDVENLDEGAPFPMGEKCNTIEARAPDVFLQGDGQKL